MNRHGTSQAGCSQDGQIGVEKRCILGGGTAWTKKEVEEFKELKTKGRGRK